MTHAARLACLFLACAAAAPPVGGPQPEIRAKEMSRQVLLMGTRATLTTWDDDEARGRQRLERLLGPLEATEARLSTWRADSEISRLNAAAGRGPQSLSAATCRLFTTLDRWVRETAGAFDPAIGPLTAVWDIHGSGRIPSRQALASARANAGWPRLSMSHGECMLRMPSGASLDVGAFGKGEGLDAARAAMAGDAAPWRIDLGGQIAVSRAPPGEIGTALAHPRKRTTPWMYLALTEGSLSTSGGSERDRRVRGTRVAHHLDPHTGMPASFDGSVSVWHQSALVADLLSTALYVMGPRVGLEWADAHAVAAVFAIPHRDGSVEGRASAAFAARFPSGSSIEKRRRAP